MAVNTLVELPRDAVVVLADDPSSPPAGPAPVVVDAGARLPVAFSSLRAVIAALDGLAPDAVVEVARRRRPEWNWLFPGTFPDAPLLADLAGTPSERRLHAESEQVFRVLDTAAEAIAAGLVASGRPLLLRGTAHADIVSLRALPRLVERLTLSEPPAGVRVELADVTPAEPGPATLAADIRRRTLASVLDRLGLTAPATPGGYVPDTVPGPAARDVAEHRQLTEAFEAPDVEPERAVAAALLAIRSCFFSANYEGAVLAAELLLDRLDAAPALDVAEVAEHFAALDPGDGTPAIGIYAEVAESPAHLRALAIRCVGVVRALVQDLEGAREEFTRALAEAPDPVSEARILLLRALLAVKRSGTLPEGIADIEHGLTRLAEVKTPVSAVEQAWLRNVRALAHVRAKEAGPAMREEKLAVGLISKLHSADATHLKINLISNISVLQEMGKKYELASATWDHFAKISSEWGDSFFKHHHYRAAGLSYLAGDAEQALAGFGAVYDLASKLDDHFHQQIVATEVGGLLLDLGEPARAGEWYARAESAASVMQDPYYLALAATGRAIAAGDAPGPVVRELASRSLAFRPEAAKLIAALDAAAGGDPSALAAALPRPTTKLNRPFRLIALDLAPSA
ncbi:hypothetical protein Skr01_51880 [Sphaerisporangium krabiense]|uniref:Tetratricopeptide (TPR) repeat protein n=1 Tax=Sphaerisporangium krabiense TaxID=763782 RepID=A0A7W8ZA14_9ACTN|nr:hypothetical protein [Sphaerisporangium krabiense]MBB5630152.1 tetratricopeptide (TPR) repeat protein [Sphaerisporangium krabiense]GII65103.1 hypothetical protein Skr01_51880 [Sphaerisporangium krabiense]